jgi:hypothetical protein
LIEHPEEIIVICATENFGDKDATFDQEFDGKFETHQYEFGLAKGILNPSRSNVGSTIVKNYICLPVFYSSSYEIATLRRGDIGSKGDDIRDRFDWNEIDTWAEA